MRHVITLLFTVFIASCAHTAISPVSTPSGEPVIIGIRDVPKGGEPKRSQIMAINETLLEGTTPETLIWKYFPELEGKGDAGVVITGLIGEAKTKSGKTIDAYVPIVVMRATAPHARVEEAATKMGADIYRRAKKAGDVYPISQLAERPKE
ncbi:hypothetical protein OKA05_06895 [Luteolibacter arcticus]|uniref:Uncharacterized protein n=1 Tax=Luteolibacter arcticus TaxID=1581411 RepID=A0ABT3GF71_9BACT|nr:hypothetical protein [Luteolibacter arcticus]MCW1922274.1 hypothetical protein [Luteolibacter arcticus]